MSFLNINSAIVTMNLTTNHLLTLLPVLVLNNIPPSTGTKGSHPVFQTLLSTYNKVTPPYPENKGQILVSMSLTPLCFELTEEGYLEGTVWYHLKWTDSRLKWRDETSNEVHVPKFLLHIPGILPVSKYVQETFDPRELASVHRNGTVFLHQRVTIKVPCDGHTWENPWEIMNCSFTYTPWTHNTATMDLRKLDRTDSVDLSKYDNEKCPAKLINGETKLWTEYYAYEDYGYVYLKYTFFLQRNWLVKSHDKHVIQSPS